MFGFKEVSDAREKEILEELEEAAKPHAPFFVLVATSTVIATFGLLLNSPAVVIGAMLVAPLMTPIFSLSVALIRVGRARLLRRSLTSELYGVGLAILVALLIGLLVPEPDLTGEILARTRPTLFDLAVALAAGLAGAFALVREELSPALPGVAVAVALLPPLAVVGIGLSMRRLDVAGGALVLFLANFVAIHLVSAGLFFLSGLATRSVEKKPTVLLKNFAFSLVVLVGMVIFLGVQLAQLVHEARDRRLIRRLLEQQVKMVEGAQLFDVKASCRAEWCQVEATVETPQAVEPVVVRGIQNVLSDALGHRTELVVRSLPVQEASASGYRFVREPTGASEKPKEEPPAAGLSERIQRLLAEQAKMVPGAKLVDFSYDAQTQPLRVVAIYLTEAPFEPALERGIANLLQSALGQEMELEVRYVGPLPRGEEEPAQKPSQAE
jgi:uncharacterized hydrophobic protein (TIGR00271 family)